MLVAASDMKVSVYRLMVDPEFYVFNYAENSRTSEFLIINEELLEVAPFVDTRLEPYARGRFTIATEELDGLVANMPQARPRQYYIFHHAFVCSTLLARSLAESEAFFSLKEPQIVRRLADLFRIERETSEARDAPGWGRFLNTHLKLLAKNYTRGRSVVIKASNLANVLMPEILAHVPSARMIYMYSSLEPFLVSNLKKLEETRQKIPSLMRLIARDGDFNERYPGVTDAAGSCFLRQCAVLWLASNHHFLARASGAFPSRVRTLDMADFLAGPRETIARASSFFDHAPSEDELDRMTGERVMNRHAKDLNQPYSTRVRDEENASVQRQHGDGITAARRWLESVTDAGETCARLSVCGLRPVVPVPVCS